MRSTCTKDNYIDSSMGTWIGYTGIEGDYIAGIYTRGTFVKGIEPKVLAGSRITLGSLGVIFTDAGINDYYFWLFIELVFAPINSVSY